jgi:hypothetical protein
MPHASHLILSSVHMSELSIKGPIEEQEICVSCGFCCDGTLFLHAHLNSGERGHLPEKIESDSFSEGDKDYFRLPCNYFSGKCTIYDNKRADICSSYRCQLLNDFAERKITLPEALEVVREAMKMRTGIFEQYKLISGDRTDIHFRKLLQELGKVQKRANKEEFLGMDYEMLMARCNIFEALLIKNIRSATDFENMVSIEDKR